MVILYQAQKAPYFVMALTACFLFSVFLFQSVHVIALLGLDNMGPYCGVFAASNSFHH